MKLLFLTWDGPEQNYLESLFFPLLDRVSKGDFEIHVLQFTWGDLNINGSVDRAAKDLGFHYSRVDIVRRPLSLATAAMIMKGRWEVERYVRQFQIDVVVARSIIPAAMVANSSAKFVFDTDGLMADERVDFGGWSPNGVSYRVFRELERLACMRADVIVTRTERARDVLIARVGGALDSNRFVAIPNGKDTTVFSPSHETSGSVNVIYVGSLGPQYVPESMFRFFSEVLKRRPEAHFKMLTGQVDLARNFAKESGLKPESFHAERVPPSEVPRHIARANLGLALRLPSFSQCGVAPIKVAEYLLCGVPVLANPGVGDLDRQIDTNVGILVEDPLLEDWATVAGQFTESILPNIEKVRLESRARGLELFDLEIVAKKYREVLWGIL